ncbi:uncharacterized protein LOC116345956 [Contarinia nasturtii]|uniref:uncharacterized protein LOC116345956 n=1 Tax=Contarinia nasturtii TaxID=265458 RepID=UPI0012D38C9A|nr:uncharacterized protein LOC116345956 [Contarinia nasturtii]
MEKRILSDLISVTTKSSDKGTIFNALVKLRAELVKDKQGIELFYNAGGIAPMVRLLSKPYEKILEGALSILGNCCTQKMCCTQAISHGIVPPLLTILKSIPNPKVQCRVCRLLGNLARESNEKLCTLAKGIGVVLASVLEDTKDVATMGMAVRATRLLWNEMPFNNEFVQSDGVEKILGILIKYTIVEQKKPEPQSLVEQNPYEKDRVEFMETHIQIMETINSRVFDHEILKKSKPVDEDGFRMPDDSEQCNLVMEILKCLETVTSIHSSLRIIYNFIRIQHSGSCITFLARGDSPYRTHSLKILSNLAKSSCHKILNEADTMTTVCNLVTATNLNKALSSAEERYCICVICLLADDSCNRAKVRKSGAFKHLLQVAKNTDNDPLLTMILTGIKYFRYDNMSMDLMIHMGLMNVLVNRLGTSIKDLKETHNTDQKKSKDAVRPRDDDEDIEMIFRKRVKMEFSPPRFIPRDIDSPTASTSSGSFYQSPSDSPGSSSSSSPRSSSPAYQTGDNYDDIDDYSPVVSDIEDQNDDDMDSKVKSKRKDDVDNNDVLQRILNEQSSSKCELEEGNLSDQGEHDDADDIKEKKEKVPNQSDISEKKKTINLVLSILCSASYRLRQLSINELCKPDILDTLIKTCRITYKRHSPEAAWDSHGAPMVLSHIIEAKNFVSLLKTNFIFQVYDMAHPEKEHQNCDLCSDLKFVGEGLLKLLNETAENGYGRGEMAHFLLKNDKEMHKQVSVISAMIIRDKKVLHTLLIKHGGLYTIIELILTKNEKLTNEAATGLTALARTLDIATPNYDTSRISKLETTVGGDAYNNADNWPDTEDLVSFVSGEQNDESNEINTVRFSEHILTENSDVFNRMFNSNFQESKNKQVFLKNQSIVGIRYFLDCVKQHSFGKALRSPIMRSANENDNGTYKIMTTLKAALEAYDMCQIYLLPDLERDILNMIVYLLSAANILELFIFSIKNHKQELTEMAINYFLTSNLTAAEKVHVMREADDCEYFKEWNDLILDTITYTCQNHSF